LDLENENDGVAGSDALVLRSDFGKLVAVLPQQLFQHDFRFFDFRGIELAFDAEADFAFLETVENVRFGNGVDAVVANAANLRAFLHFKDDNFSVRAIGGILHAELNVLEELRVPQGLKIAAQRFFIKDIAGTTTDSRTQGVVSNAAITDKIDAVDDILLLRDGLRTRRGTPFYNI